MTNIIDKINLEAKTVKNFGIKEVFVIDGEVYITSLHDLPCDLISNIEGQALAL